MATVPMTDEECRIATAALMPKIERYAELVVRKGVAVQPGQEILLSAPVERADFARILVRKAYEAGAGHVTVVWSDDEVGRLEYENCPLEYFEHTPGWKKEQLNSLAEMGAGFLFVEGSDPNALKGIDPAKPAAAVLARSTECKPFREGMEFGRNAWCIAGAPVAAWAKKVFPKLSEAEAVYRLWEAILDVAHASGPDPMGEWERHDATFEKNKRFLNGKRFDALHYTASNGTDLTVGLNPGGLWDGGSGTTTGGVKYFPNIPTEEVFTTPDRTRADGIVKSAMPLVHAGQIVRDFWFRFEGGAVVDYGAVEGKDVLRSILETDENAVRLGECALISKNTPIRQRSILFYDTLYDENASCHLAIGMGFPECLEGGLEMDKDQLLAANVNQSHTHVDFMIGTDDLNVDGITADGEVVPVFVNGQWAWE